MLKEIVIEKVLHANNIGIHANLGHSLRGSQSMQELAPGMRNVLPFLIKDAQSCIEYEPHKG